MRLFFTLILLALATACFADCSAQRTDLFSALEQTSWNSFALTLTTLDVMCSNLYYQPTGYPPVSEEQFELGERCCYEAIRLTNGMVPRYAQNLQFYLDRRSARFEECARYVPGSPLSLMLAYQTGFPPVAEPATATMCAREVYNDPRSTPLTQLPDAFAKFQCQPRHKVTMVNFFRANERQSYVINSLHAMRIDVIEVFPNYTDTIDLYKALVCARVVLMVNREADLSVLEPELQLFVKMLEAVPEVHVVAETVNGVSYGRLAFTVYDLIAADAEAGVA